MADEKKVGFFARIGKFFKDYKSEFKKIVWPTPKEALKLAGIVLVCIAVVSLVIFVLDTGFSSAIVALGNLI